jgi:hypothetical protein
MNFYYDEWNTIVGRRAWDLNVLLWPHNEHWSTIQILIWKSLFVVFGISSHLPYEAALLVAHVASVILLFVLVRRRSGTLPAFASATLLLVLGSGGADIVWAFQIGFVGSVAFGLLAMVWLDSKPDLKHASLGSAALVCSLMCSAVGLAFLVAIATELLFDRHRRRHLLAMAPPVFAFAAWYLAYDTGSVPGLPGTSGSLSHRLSDLHFLWAAIKFIAYGLSATAAGVFGLQAAAGILVLSVFIVLVVLRCYRQRMVKSWQLGMALGLVGWFSLTALGRAQAGPGLASDAHYLYIGAAFLLPLVSDAVADFHWRGLWRPILIFTFLLAIFVNTVDLWTFTQSQSQIMATENAELQTVEVFRGAPDMALYRPFDTDLMPQLDAARFFPAVDELGSPVPKATVDTIMQIPPQAVDTLMLNLFSAALDIQPDPTRKARDLPCRTFDSSDGSTIETVVQSGQSIVVEPSRSGSVELFLSFRAPFSSKPVRRLQLEAGKAQRILVPNTGKPVAWHLRMKTTLLGPVLICGEATLAPRSGQNYEANASGGSLGPGWSLISDLLSTDKRAAKARVGATHVVRGRYANDTFGQAFVPQAGVYDVWFRVRVATAVGLIPEMVLGLWDEGESGAWAGSSVFRPVDADTQYKWLLAGKGVWLTQRHPIQFQATVDSRLSTDWFVDSARLVPTGSLPRT